ncbi:MAG: TonB-dependent receptor, partial [Pseudomonadota bacterium]
MASSSSYAQTLEEVVVTAQKRSESAQDVPISISVLSGNQIANMGAINLEGLSDSIPNVDIADSPGTTRVVIRGLGTGTGNSGFEQSVGMYVDGIYASRAALFQSPFLDLARIEVLKGPQGVLFGKNSIAGAISIISNKPTDLFEAEIAGSYEFEYESHELGGFLSGPLLDNLYGRFAARTTADDAYMDNAFRGEDVPTVDTDIVRGTFVWQPTDVTDVMFKAEYSEIDERGASWQAFADYSVGTLPYLIENDPNYIPPTPAIAAGAQVYREAVAGGENFIIDDTSFLNGSDQLKQDNDNYTLRIGHSVAEHEIVYLFGYGSYNRDQTSDQDFTAPNVVLAQITEKFDQTSHELKWISPGGETIDYIFGLYYLERHLDEDITRDFFEYDPFLSNSIISSFSEDSETYSAFTKLTWNVTDTWRTSVGLRYSEEEKKATKSQLVAAYGSDESLQEVNPAKYALLQAVFNSPDFEINQTRTEDNLDPAASVQWDFSPQGMAYISWNRASKAGGFNAAESNGSAANFSFEPEEAESFEIGAKSDFLESRLRLNAAIFYTQFDDKQEGAFDPTVNGFVVKNAAKAVSQGIELEGLYAANDSLSFGATIAYLEAEYEEFTASCPANRVEAAALDCFETPDGQLVQNLDGVQLDNAPEISAALYADHSL